MNDHKTNHDSSSIVWGLLVTSLRGEAAVCGNSSGTSVSDSSVTVGTTFLTIQTSWVSMVVTVRRLLSLMSFFSLMLLSSYCHCHARALDLARLAWKFILHPDQLLLVARTVVEGVVRSPKRCLEKISENSPRRYVHALSTFI